MPQDKKKKGRNVQVATSILKGSKPIFTDVTRTPKGIFQTRTVVEVNRPEGKRLFTGQGKSKSLQMSRDKSLLSARRKAVVTPADSVSHKAFSKFLKSKK